MGSFEQKQQGDIKKTISKLGDGATLLYSQKNVSVVRVDKYEAGQKLFSEGWCVQNNPDHFDGTYHPPYFMFTLDSRPYALYHQDSGQFKNEHDNSMNLSETVPLLDSLRYLVKNNIIQPESSGEHEIIKETFEVGDMVNHACETKDFNNLQNLLKKISNFWKTYALNGSAVVSPKTRNWNTLKPLSRIDLKKNHREKSWFSRNLLIRSIIFMTN